jgi:hypothetical protein
MSDRQTSHDASRQDRCVDNLPDRVEISTDASEVFRTHTSKWCGITLQDSNTSQDVHLQRLWHCKCS